MNKVGLIDIKKAYLGTKLLSPNNAFVGTEQLLEDTNHLIISKRGGSGTVTVTFSNISAHLTIQYSKHPYGTFTTASVNSAVTLTGDEKLYLKGNLTADNDGDNGDYTNIKITSNLASTDWATLSGNCNAIWSSGIRKQCGLRLFSGSWAVRYVSENFLPATTLAHACYQRLFENCTWLMNVPKLPATSISGIGNIYQLMFSGCSKLTTVPSDLLPIMDLSGGGAMYGGMFQDCTSLTTAPNLPATTIGLRCYEEMFKGCTSLTTAPELPATTLTTRCYRMMFRGCTSLTTAPELPATILTNLCYEQMFDGCSILNYIKCLATNISASNCTTNWVYGVAPTGTFVKSPIMSSWTIGDSGIPTGWVVLNEIGGVKFTALEANSTLGLLKLSAYLTLQYSTDGVVWTNMTTTSTITLNNIGDNVYVRGKLTGNNLSDYTRFKMTGKIAASGNITYIYDYEHADSTTLTYTLCYQQMFFGCTSLTSAPDLPAIILSEDCYADMFAGCTSLTSAPYLQATTLAVGCYNFIFANCTSLVNVLRTLPASNLERECYFGMFQGCTSLTTAPEILATSLADSCCVAMFYNCTSLTIAPTLPITTLAYDCYRTMFYGCTSLTTAPALNATTLENLCYNSMFEGCTSLTAAPELPATTLYKRSYYHMFYGCTNLNYIKCLATNISATDCTTDWVTNTAASGTFVKSRLMSSWTTGVNGIPNNWAVQNI